MFADWRFFLVDGKQGVGGFYDAGVAVLHSGHGEARARKADISIRAGTRS